MPVQMGMPMTMLGSRCWEMIFNVIPINLTSPKSLMLMTVLKEHPRGRRNVNMLIFPRDFKKNT